ncbi:MAG TPA: transposase [Micromonospora sp.]|nr:transposase [Micromonospora sp.]
MTPRADALFELTDAVLCVDGPVTSLAELSLAGCFRCGHGALYDALAAGAVDADGVRGLLVDHLPADGPVTFTVDVSVWPRPDAECSPQRLHCHQPCRCDGVRQTIPGCPYQVVALLEPGTSSWTAPCDAVRLGPDDDTTEVTADQIHDLLGRLRRQGRLTDGDAPPLGVFDSGYDLTRLGWLLRDDVVQLLGRIRADRVFYTPSRRPGAATGGSGVGLATATASSWPTPTGCPPLTGS